MGAVEAAAEAVGACLLIRAIPWAVRSLVEVDRALRRATARSVRHRQEAEPDLEALLLGPYLTTPEHHDFIADRWSVIADAAVVVAMEQSLKSVKSPRERGVRGRR